MAEKLTQAVFAALADPTRRYLVERLTEGSATITELAADLPMSRQAVKKHLNLLEDAHLVVVTPSGRERHHALSVTALQEASQWASKQRPLNGASTSVTESGLAGAVR